MRALLAAVLLLCLPAPALAQTPFAADGATVNLAATSTTGRVQVQTGGSKSMRVYNAGTVAVFVACGDVTVVATAAAGMPVAPGTVEVIGCAQTYIAGITSSGTATVYVTPGSGL